MHNIAFANSRYLFADRIEYNDKDQYVEAIGNVKIAFDNYIIEAERILYDFKKDEVYSYGKILAKDDRSYISMGESAIIKNKAKEVIISSFILYFKDSDAIIASKIAIRKNQNHSSLYKASYTSCPACSKYRPLWQISASKADIYLDKKTAIYRNMFFEIYGIPILYFPYFSHPLPGAKPKSGILIPNIKHQKPGLPIYIRPKSNFDVTITTRIAKNGGLFDLEVRHLMDYGSYRISGISAGRKMNVPIVKNDKVLSESKIQRYSISGNGEFKKNDSHYGFNINRVSDRDFLRRYTKIDSPFLLSNIYTYKVDNENYWELNNSFIQGLNPEDTPSSNPNILPEINMRKNIELEKLNDTNLTIENHTSSFMTDDLGRVTRSIWELNLNNSFTTKSGGLVGFELYNRSDIYNVNLNRNNNEKSAGFIRNIPEARLSLKYPLLSRIGNKSLIIEPVGMLALGKKKIKESSRVEFIDSKKYEFDDINFYKFNRFNGYDYHENGNRLTYGSQAILKSNSGITTGLFLGQLQNISKNEKQKPNIVGRMHLNSNDQVEIYYRFKKKSKNFKPAFDEVGFWLNRKRLSINGGYISISKSELLLDEAMKQIYLDTNYDYNQNWLFGFNTRIDVAKSNPREMSRGLRVTYRGDCVTISTNFTRDNTSDSSRGIRKTSDYSFAISLKTLNM